MSDENLTEDVDKLYDSIMGTGEGSDGPSGTTTEVQTQEPVAPPVPSTDFEFTHNGKQIKATKDAIIKWASQGYDYSQKMADFNKRLSDVDARYSQAEQLKTTYGPVDEWVKGNPDKWDALQKAIQNTEASGANPQLLSKLQTLEQQVLQANQFIEASKQREEEQKKAQEDSALDTEMKSIQEKYKDLDWKTVDESGRGLEAKILDHAVQNGINSYKAAFHDLLSDELTKLAEARGRESLNKERQVKQAGGVVGKTSQPTKGITKTNGVKSKSYDDLAEEGLRELGIIQ